MYIHRGLLLVIMVIFIFSPAILNWIIDNHSAWYRPYLAWLLIIALAYAAQWWAGKRDNHA